MIGSMILWIAFAAALVSTYAYFRAAERRKSATNLARNSFAMMALALVFSAALLLLYLLRHQFEFTYVWEYSSRSLPFHLLVTTFWAGQEGSFLFWALCGSIIGLILMLYLRGKQIELEVMSFYSLAQTFLLLLLIVKSPFRYIWEAHPQQFAVGAIPADGRGLNPLLQNIWMIAHPPVLFMGFAAMAVPFAFALAALWRKDYVKWLSGVFPWVIFGTITLGAGIMLGGYWAYGVLGWGGWWGWDPVENSSLIPWMVGIILIHTMAIQKRTGSLSRTNFILAILTYVFVVYSTFLTRSGILGDSSVHSFLDPGALAYTLLVVWIAMSLVVGFGMVAKRWRELKSLAQHWTFWTRESFLAIGSAVMGSSALVILFGTSWPILSHASLESAFYDRTNLPLAIALALLLGLSLLVLWREGSPKDLMKNSLASLCCALVGVAVLIVFGVREISLLLFAAASLFAFFVNAIRLYRLAKESYLYTGGALAHIGLALLFLGIIGSGRYAQKQTVALPLGETKAVLGYAVTYAGSEPTQDGKWKFTLRVEKDGSRFQLEPVMFQSDYNNGLMRNPDYASFLTRDFYVEPVSLERDEVQQGSPPHNLVQLKKGEPRRIGNVLITFVRFQMDHQGTEDMTAGSGFVVGAVLEVVRGKMSEIVVPTTLYKEGQSPQPRIAKTKDGAIGLELWSMAVDAGTGASSVDVNVTGIEGLRTAAQRNSEALIVEASVKPFISLVWAAAVLMIAGLTISLRSKLVRRREDAEGAESHRTGGGQAMQAKREDRRKRAEELAER